jgi:chaperone LolA
MHPTRPIIITTAAALLMHLALPACNEGDGKGKTLPSASASASEVSPFTSADFIEPDGGPPDEDFVEDDGGEGGGDVAPPTSAEVPPETSGKATAPAPGKKKKKKTEPQAPDPAPGPEPAPPAPVQPPPATEQALDPAKEGSADEVAEKLDAIFKPVTRFRAAFNQKYKAHIHNTTKKSKGVLYVLRPSKLSLSYHDPNKNRAVSDGTTLKVYEHENKQMFVKDVKNTEYPGAFSFILGKGLRQSFTFTFHKKSKWEGGPVIIGTPRIQNPGYKKVLFYVDEELLKKGDLGCIRRVLVVDAQKNENRFDFINAEAPESIPDSFFEFEPPAGTEIIKS